jgi:hypothetical protein
MQSKTILAIAAFASLTTLASAQDKSSEKDILTIFKGAHSYKEVSVGGKTTEIYVDDMQVAQSEAPHYDSLIQVMRTDVDEENRDLARSDEENARDEEQAGRDREQDERDRARAREDMARMREIIRFLVDKKIVPDQAHLNGLVLTNGALYVNGVKQPKDIHETLKEKYPEWAHYGVTYGKPVHPARTSTSAYPEIVVGK